MRLNSLYAAALATIPLMGLPAQAQQPPKSHNPLGEFTSSSSTFSFVGDNKRIRIQGDKAVMRIAGDITPELAEEICAALDVFEANEANKSKTLYVHINSNGGDMDSSVAIADKLKHLPGKVVTVAEGKVMSGGLLIFMLGGDERRAYENTLFMGHPSIIVQTSEDASEQEKTMARDMQEIAIIQATRLFGQFKHAKTLRPDQVVNMFSGGDCYFGTGFAQWAGLVTHVLGAKGQIMTEVPEDAPRAPEYPCPSFRSK